MRREREKGLGVKYRAKGGFRGLLILIACCLVLTGCGSGGQDQPYTINVTAEPEATATPTPAPKTPEELLDAGPDTVHLTTKSEIKAEVMAELYEKGYSSALATKESRKQITVGIFSSYVHWSSLTAVGLYNISQDQYWLEVKEYDSYSDLIFDIMMGEGADIFYLNGMPFDLLGSKGVLEDLTPYFEESEVISRELVLDCIWNAGTVNGKYVGVIPKFAPYGYLVEKGVTENGGWTLDDYFALADKYPKSMPTKSVKTPSTYILNFMSQVIQAYIDWEEMTCDFDSEEFRRILQKVKEYADKEYESKNLDTDAEKLYEKEYLTYPVRFACENVRDLEDFRLDMYLEIRDVFLDSYDLVGFPNEEGIPWYDMTYYEMYGINAVSENKEAAWTFIEYLFSEEYQMPGTMSTFPGRKDTLEFLLDTAIGYQCTSDRDTTYNTYTEEKEKIMDIDSLTREDKENILYIIDNCYRNTMEDNDILWMILEESEPYFAGDKSLDDVVKIIQNRASLYLDEYKE